MVSLSSTAFMLTILLSLYIIYSIPIICFNVPPGKKLEIPNELLYLEWFNLHTTLVLLLECFGKVLHNHVGDIVNMTSSLK